MTGVVESWMFAEEVDGRDDVDCATSDVDGPATGTSEFPLEDIGPVTDADAPAACGFAPAF